MSKSSTATAPKIPTQLPVRSAWSRGPPQAATAPSPRSQSPAPSTPVHQTHSRRPSALQGVHVKDGVTVTAPRNNVGVAKQGSAVTFGSIDDTSAPISSSPAAAPSIKSEGVRSFGTVPANTGHVNGKASISRSPVIPPAASSSSSAASTPPASAAATPAKPKIDIKKMFQNPSSAPSSNPPSDSSSPSMRNANLPSQPSSSHQGQSSHPPPSQLGAHSYTPFVPSGSMRPPPNNGPNGGPPRSPQYTRQMANGIGPRSQGGQNGGPSAGLSSPRLGPPHNGQPSPMPPPQMQPQMHQHMGMPWGNYYGYNPEQQHYMYPPQWYPHMPMQPPHGQHPPQTPGPHIPPHPGMPMSPRNPPSTLQGPGTPTLPHAMPNPVHAPHPPPAISHAPSPMGGLTSPPPTPSSNSIPTNRLNAGSSAFVPRSTKVTLKKEDGTEVNLENLKSIPTPVVPNAATPSPQGSAYRQGSPGTPNRRPASIRIESEDQRKLRLAQEEQKEKEHAKLKAEAEEKVKKEKEEAERKVKEAEEKKRKQEERIRKEEEEKKEKERLRLEEEERARKEAEEREAKRVAEEEERKRKAEEEAEAKRVAEEKAKEEEQRLEKERVEKERLEKEKAENERLAKEAEAERLRLEQEEAAKKAVPEPDAQADDKVESGSEDGELTEDAKDVEASAPSPLKDEAKERPKDGLRINTGTTPPTVDRRRPGPLDLSHAKNNTNNTAPLSALATARIISDINTVQYPAGVSSPQADLNENAKEGKFRYNRDFLLQFMDYCKEKPANLPPLDAIGLEPVDHSAHSLSRGGSGRHRQSSGAAPSSRQGSIGLGFSPGTFAKGSTNPFAGMGNFGTAGASKLSSEDRFAMSASANRAASVTGAPGMQYTSRPAAVTRTASQGGPGAPLRDRTRSKRGEKRGEHNKAGGGGGNQQSHGFSNFQNQQQANLEPVVPLQATENRWDRKALQVDADSPEMVDRKVKGLLNKLTMEKFDSISDQIISWANKSEKEKDGRTLIQVIRLVFEKATDEATWSEMYARLCRKMMEQISSKVQDDGIKNNDGKPIAGGQLFRKYLLNRCQEDFERGWVAKEATAAAAASKALEDEAIKAANDKTKESGKDEEVVLYSDEYYAAQKAKRQGLGLIKFIGELFKLQMLTERIMHECVKKLLGNVDNPEEEEIESLCKLLTTVGGILDNQKARAHLDVYFSRMKELTKSPNVTPRMQYMLQDLVELRDRKWVTRNTVAAPTTLAQIHETAAKEKAAAEKESYQRQVSMSRGGSRRGGDRSEYPQVGPDGWAVAGGGGSGPPRPPPKAGDLSNFGKISKAQPMTFGPSSVFAGKKGPESKREAISRTNSSSNMFSMLSSQAAESGEAATKAAEPMQRKRLVLQPRSRPVEAEATEPTESPVADSDSEAAPEDAPGEMTEADAKKKISEDLKEFFAVRNLDEAEVYFTGLPAQYHHTLVDKLVSHATESKEAEAKLVSDFFARVTSNDQCTPAAFEQGFTPIAEIIDDIAIDAPKAFQLFAMMIKGAGLDEARRTNLASKSIDSDKLLALLQ